MICALRILLKQEHALIQKIKKLINMMNKITTDQFFKRRGRVRVSKSLLFEYPETARAFFNMFFPLEITHTWDNYIEYVGLCPNFKEIKDNEPIPSYDFVFEDVCGFIIISHVEQIKTL